MTLKDFLVVQDSDDKYHVWPLEKYDRYIRQAVGVGAGSAFKVVTHFNANEDLLKSESIPSVTNEEDELWKANLKDFTVKFFQWWYNQPGSNTNDGYDSFLETDEGQREYENLKQSRKPSSSSLHS